MHMSSLPKILQSPRGVRLSMFLIDLWNLWSQQQARAYHSYLFACSGRFCCTWSFKSAHVSLYQ